MISKVHNLCSLEVWVDLQQPAHTGIAIEHSPSHGPTTVVVTSAVET